MRVLYDHQIFTEQVYGGISRYFSQLLIELSKLPEVSVELPDICTYNEHLPAQYRTTPGPLLESPMKFIKRYARKRVERLNKLATQKALQTGKYDIFHPTYYDHDYLSHKHSKRVVTIHDMIHEIYGEMIDKGGKLSALKRRECELADHIICVSHSTKRDLIEQFKIEPEKITVVHLGGGESVEMQVDASTLQLPEKYFLYVGKRGYYKKFETLYDAALPLLKNKKELHLICTGPAFSMDEQKQFEADGVAQQVMNLYVSDADLQTLYKGASAFVFPSEYEGFGIPTLEAMSVGCPTILQQTSSLPEVGGDAALYFEDNSVEQLRAHLESIIHDSDLRLSLRQKGIVQAGQFSWERCARETLTVYQNLL